MKDLFSQQSPLYKAARPSYPVALIQEILKHVAGRQRVWDCAAGSGQLTQLLVPYFADIIATDLSAEQLAQAPQFDHVHYQVQAAEHSDFPDQYFDLITVAQAIHWFDFDKFYAEVKRTLKADGHIAVIGYGLVQVDDVEINTLVQQLYYQVLNGYWDAERRYIDEEYQSIAFPFQQIAVAPLKMCYVWQLSQLLAYLNTWSAIRHYRQQNADNPLAAFEEKLTVSDQQLQLHFPIFLRLGKI